MSLSTNKFKKNQFNWTPYSEDVLNSLPVYCTRHRNSWRCETYIICWEIVETHLVSRVMRQFGMFQPILNAPLFDYSTHIVQHRLSRVNRENVNWANHHAHYIGHWNHRFAYIQNGNQVPNFAFATDEYMRWYIPRIVLYITNLTNEQDDFQPLSEAREFLMDGMSQVYNQNTGSQYMQYIEGENWMRQGPSHFQEDYQPVPTQQVERAQRERRQQRQPDAYAGSSNAFAGTSNPFEGYQDTNLGQESMNYQDMNTHIPPPNTDYMLYFVSPQNMFQHQDMGQPSRPSLNFTPIEIGEFYDFSDTQMSVNLGEDNTLFMKTITKKKTYLTKDDQEEIRDVLVVVPVED